MKYYIISGEASGDLHASNLMRALKKEESHTDFRFWGGDLMGQIGGTMVKHYRELAFMGFAEVFMNLRTILNNIKFCKQDILEYGPDAIILVDYPGFNLRIAEFAKKKKLPFDESLRMTDRGLSGYHGLHRTKGVLGTFLRCVENGEVIPGSILVVENIDRLSREGAIKTLQQIIFKLWDRGITLQTLSPEESYEPGCGNDPKF